MKKSRYITPSIEVCQAELCHLMANTLETEDERAPQGAREMDESWGSEWDKKFENVDDEFDWDDYHRSDPFEEL